MSRSENLPIDRQKRVDLRVPSRETTHQGGQDVHVYVHALQAHVSEKPVPCSSSHSKKGC